MPYGYNLSNKDTTKLNNLIDGKHSFYYFKNFLDITNGNLKDAIKLYRLDDRLRTVLFRYILKFELVLKNDFVTLAELSGASTTFWNNSSYFLQAATTISPGKSFSKFDELVTKVNHDIAHKVFSNNPIQNVNIFYSISYGDFLRYYELIDHRYKNDFIQKHFNGQLNYFELKKYLNSIRLIRNRCAHSNHIVSPKLRLEQRRMQLINLSREFGIFHTEFSKSIHFIYKTLQIEDQKRFKKDTLFLLYKYNRITNQYFLQHTIDKNLFDKLQKLWSVKMPFLNKLLYNFKYYVKI